MSYKPKYADCDCDTQEPNPSDYVCKDCHKPITICSECSTIISGCECGTCSDGGYFIEGD